MQFNDLPLPSGFGKTSPAGLVKVSDVAKFLACSRATVHGLLDCGALEAVRLTTGTPRRKPKRVHVRITRASVERLIEKNSATQRV